MPADATHIVRIGLSVVGVDIAIVEIQVEWISVTKLGRRQVVVGNNFNSSMFQFSESLIFLKKLSDHQSPTTFMFYLNYLLFFKVVGEEESY